MGTERFCRICDLSLTPGKPCSNCQPAAAKAAPGKVYRPMQRSVEHTELMEASRRQWLVEQGETASSYAEKVIALRFRAQANGRTVGEQALAEMREKNPALVSVLKRNWRNENKGQG